MSRDRRRPALVKVRCAVCGHWLADLNRQRDGGLRIRYDARHMLDPATFGPVHSPDELAALGAPFITEAPFTGPDGSALWMQCRACTGQWPMSAPSEEIRAAADAATAAGRPGKVLAVPSVIATATEVPPAKLV